MSSMKDRFKKRAKEGAQKGFSVNLPENVKRFVPKKGTYKLDVIPYAVSAKKHPDGVAAGELWCRRPYLTHFNIGVDNKSQICPRTIGKPCPICEYYERERKRPGADEEALREIRAKARELYNVIDLDNEDDGVQVLDFSYHNFGKLLEGEINEADDDDIAGFAELKGGKTLKIRFSEATMGKNKFLEATRIDFLDRDAYKKAILEDVVDLDTVFTILPYEDLEAVFLEDEGADMKSGSDDDDDDAPKSKKSSKKASKDDDDDDDEAPKKSSKKTAPKDDDDDDDDDEKPKSRRTSKKEEMEEERPGARRKPKDDDDDDDDEKPKPRRAAAKPKDDDDEEDEAPKAKAKAKKKPPVEDDDEDEAPAPKSKKKAPADDDDEDEAPKAKSKAKKPAPKDDDDDDDETPAPKAAKKAGKGGECPLSNGVFGKDFNKFDECDDCEVWSECGKVKRSK